jgi:lysophospholipase
MQVIRDSHDSKRFHAAIFNPEEQLPTHHPLSKRASPDAPNGYIPTAVTCPYPLPIIRNSSSLSPNETSWLSARRSKTTSSFKALLQRIAIDGFDTNGFFNTSNDNDLPTLGIALSGGGYRAMLNGAGAVKGFDDRTDGSTDTGKGGVGGVLQAATYLSGLSGGSWMMGSMYVQNFSSVSGILSGDPTKGVWELDQSIFEGEDLHLFLCHMKVRLSQLVSVPNPKTITIVAVIYRTSKVEDRKLIAVISS